MRETDEHQESSTDAAGDAAVHAHFRPRYALQQDSHVRSEVVTTLGT
jgi:hypothetical protein